MLRGFAFAAIVLCWLSSSASASQVVALDTGFSPDRLGASTTIDVGFSIGTTNGAVPSPLTNFDLKLPTGVGLGETTLGTAICSPKVLEMDGPDECPSNALMGTGNASVEVPIGTATIREPVSLAIYMGPPVEGHTSMLFCAIGVSPVAAELIFPSVLLGEAGSFGAHLVTEVPLVPTLPGAPDAAVTVVHSSLGPQGIIYHKRVRGKWVTYRPIGMAVPETCPRGGFQFSAEFTFQDGSHAMASSAVPCPRRAPRGG
jgi:hypothetical protein